MKSLFLSAAMSLLQPLLFLFSFFLLIRGHNEPGGGFVGGLVAGLAMVLLAVANGTQQARKMMRFEPTFYIAIGLAIALFSGVISLLSNQPFLTGIWLKEPLPILGKFGTPFLFDIGVYIVVFGIITKILLSLTEEAE